MIYVEQVALPIMEKVKAGKTCTLQVKENSVPFQIGDDLILVCGIIEQPCVITHVVRDVPALAVGMVLVSFVLHTPDHGIANT